VTTAPSPPTSGAQGERAARVLATERPDLVVSQEEAYGEVTVTVAVADLVAVCELLRDHGEAQYTMPLFMSAVDHSDDQPEGPRFELTYQLRSLVHNDVCRVAAWVGEDAPHAPTLEGVFPGMDWHERECYDLMGIVFDGHHNLQRILLPDDWDGHPLRKDYVSFGEPIAFTHNVEWALPATQRPPGMPGSSR